MSPDHIRRVRTALGLTQQQFAERLGVSFVTLNRWENGQTRPSALAIEKLKRAAAQVAGETGEDTPGSTPPAAATGAAVRLDFLGDAEAVRVLVEGERLSYGHLVNPAFATEISRIDPLPHQRIAVYDRMLPQPRLRFLLADDAGAGKTIMTGLYIREALSRRTLRRVLVVAPAGLVGNWRRELSALFRLDFRIVTGADVKAGNPFLGEAGNRIVVSVDSLRGPRLFAALRDPAVAPYDLAVFDEAHKLACHRDPDGTIRPTARYRLAEAIAGVREIPDEHRLPWSAQHLLLLTATPHMGKPYPYYALWRLLEPELLSTPNAFEHFPAAARQRHFIRRVKEEMVDLHGKPLYPTRLCDTHSYELSQGDVSEQTLYERTTAYINTYYNLARMLNRQAARFAIMVFQRRLASSTWALLCSLRKRAAKLDRVFDAIRSGALTEADWQAQQTALNRKAAAGKLSDLLDVQTADEEGSVDGEEAHAANEDAALDAFVATNLAELQAERGEVHALIALAEAVHARGRDSKFERLRELLAHADYREQKVIIYTEHKDTLDFLARALEGLGYAGQVATVHGGMGYAERDAAVEHFRAEHRQGGSGARFFVGTDAAAEGINLQFCWILVNYDVPWNPARLEQRMGRIHRYGQRHDPVSIINLVAGATREGRVIKTLLEKLEEIRRQLGSDKVFDVVGRLFEEVSLSDYVRRAVESDDSADHEAMAIAGRLTVEQMRALAAREEYLYGQGGEVAADLPRLREAMEIEALRHLLPGYVRRYLERAAPLVGVDLVGDLDDGFLLRPRRRGVLERLLPALEGYVPKTLTPTPPPKGEGLLPPSPLGGGAAGEGSSLPSPPGRGAGGEGGILSFRFSVYPPKDAREAIHLHPGEPVFERLSAIAVEATRDAGQRGAIFTDAASTEPYLFHVARITVTRAADPAIPGLGAAELVEQRLVGLRQFADNRLEETAVEQLLLLKPGRAALPASVAFLAHSETWRLAAAEHLRGAVAGRLAELQQLAARARLEETEVLLKLACDYREAELARVRKDVGNKARGGDSRAAVELERIRAEQRALATRRAEDLTRLRREVALIAPGEVEIIATALVQPSQDPDDLLARDLACQRIAMDVAIAAEQARGADVRDVSTPAQARLAGLNDYPGFDLFSRHPEGERGIEVKGRVGTGDVELTDNEWSRACNERGRYWLYVVVDCGTPKPRLLRVQDPFRQLIAKGKGSVVLSYSEIARCAR